MPRGVGAELRPALAGATNFSSAPHAILHCNLPIGQLHLGIERIVVNHAAENRGSSKMGKGSTLVGSFKHQL